MQKYERLLQDDLNIGVDEAWITNPGGGRLRATQAGLHSFARGQVAYQADWTPGTIAAGSYAETTVTVPDSVPGDLVMASHDQMLTDSLRISGHVSVAGTAEVVLHNPTAAAVTVAAGTVSVLVFPTGVEPPTYLLEQWVCVVDGGDFDSIFRVYLTNPSDTSVVGFYMNMTGGSVSIPEAYAAIDGSGTTTIDGTPGGNTQLAEGDTYTVTVQSVNGLGQRSGPITFTSTAVPSGAVCWLSPGATVLVYVYEADGTTPVVGESVALTLGGVAVAGSPQNTDATGLATFTNVSAGTAEATCTVGTDSGTVVPPTTLTLTIIRIVP